MRELMDRSLLARVLVAVAATEPAAEALSAEALDRLAAETATTAFEMRAVCAYAQSAGLLRTSSHGALWRLTRAGRQFLARGGAVDHSLLAFLPQTIDDLNSRSALVRGGVSLVAQFRQALLDGRARHYARELVPDAFQGAVDEPLALDLYAAAVSLIARLEAEQPPACMAEQLLVSQVAANAGTKLENDVADGALSDEDAAAARDELRSLSKLIPSRGRPRAPVESWFRPFPGAAATAYVVT
jgi:hypothetical protein